MSNITIFSELITAYPTWTSLSAFLKSEAGGYLRIDDNSSPENPFALIRYVKGKSNLSLSHVRAFRSVVWDVLEHCPVSVTPFKSQDGEDLPDIAVLPSSKYCVQEFVDGVMIGMFWDKYKNTRRIHTRSTLDAGCRYFSQTKTFKQMFDEVNHGLDDRYGALNSNISWTFVLQHPENRIVTAVTEPKLICVQEAFIKNNGVVTVAPPKFPVYPSVRPVVSYPLTTPTEIWHKMALLGLEYPTQQGLVVKDLATGDRWKIRTTGYNKIRQMRGNSPRRDFLWLTMWRNGTLRDYTTVYPEERFQAEAMVQKWKAITNSVFHIYTDVFKARSMDKSAIPPKFRPLVYGLHNLYMESLKPAQKSVDWKTTLGFMNSRDVAQMLFVTNWEAREAAKATNVPTIPLEPASVIGTEVTETIQEQPRTDDAAVTIESLPTA